MHLWTPLIHSSVLLRSRAAGARSGTPAAADWSYRRGEESRPHACLSWGNHRVRTAAADDDIRDPDERCRRDGKCYRQRELGNLWIRHRRPRFTRGVAAGGEGHLGVEELVVAAGRVTAR